MQLPVVLDSVGTIMVLKAAGWGRTMRNAKTLPQDLETADFVPLYQNDCNAKWVFMNPINNKMICMFTGALGNQNISAWNRDSGDPVMDVIANDLIRILSYGSNDCVAVALPNILGNVAIVDGWIASNIAS